MFLTETEIKDLTHMQRRPAQARALRAMGIEHKRRPDGSLVVLKKHAEHVLGQDGKSDDNEESELNWESDASIPKKVRK